MYFYLSVLTADTSRFQSPPTQTLGTLGAKTVDSSIGQVNKLKDMEITLTVDQITKTTEFADFYKSATDFCDFIENYPDKSNVDFLQATRLHLLNLYGTALKLQWVDLKSDADFDDKLPYAIRTRRVLL